eukprot:scpid42812/ scgid25164/ 
MGCEKNHYTSDLRKKIDRTNRCPRNCHCDQGPGVAKPIATVDDERFHTPHTLLLAMQDRSPPASLQTRSASVEYRQPQRPHTLRSIATKHPYWFALDHSGHRGKSVRVLNRTGDKARFQPVATTAAKENQFGQPAVNCEVTPAMTHAERASRVRNRLYR